MIKLVATDLDGTLLYPKKRIAGLCSSNRKFLRFLSDNSIEIVLVTGRNPKILKKINKIAHNDCKLFGCNGAYLVTKDGIKDKKPLNRDKLLLLFSELYGRYGIFGYFLFDDSQYTHIFLKNLSPTISNVFRLGNFFNGVLKEKLIIGEENFFKTIPYKDYYKFMISVGLGEEAKKRAIELAYAINEKYSDYFSVVSSDTAIEVTSKDVDKGKSLLRYIKKRGIDEKECLVIGDSANDIPMFTSFSHSFCMSHSKAFVKAKANHIVELVSDIKRYILDPSLLEQDQIKK